MDIRFHTVRAHLRGAPATKFEILFDGNDGTDGHRKAFERAATDPRFDTVAIFEHCTPRMVVHPAATAAPAARSVAEVKTPEPETTPKRKR